MPLPILLAGPILRRVEPRLVVVWVALSEPAAVRLDVYDGLQHGGSGTGLATVDGQPVVSATVDTRRFGAHLHAALMVAEATSQENTLRPGALYSYNVTIAAGPTGTHDLNSLGLLRGEPGGVQALGYQDDLLPSFATAPDTLERLVLLHASCNKLHGQGQGVIGHLDDLIADGRGDPLERPHQLFLTGDQVYADDVPAALLPALNRVGRLLVGGDEQLPGVGAAAGPYDATLENFPAGLRQRLVATAGLTSTDAANHARTRRCCAWCRPLPGSRSGSARYPYAGTSPSPRCCVRSGSAR